MREVSQTPPGLSKDVSVKISNPSNLDGNYWSNPPKRKKATQAERLPEPEPPLAPIFQPYPKNPQRSELVSSRKKNLPAQSTIASSSRRSTEVGTTSRTQEVQETDSETDTLSTLTASTNFRTPRQSPETPTISLPMPAPAAQAAQDPPGGQEGNDDGRTETNIPIMCLLGETKI